MCLYEQINTAFACISMDMKNIEAYADQPEKVKEIKERIAQNIATGSEAVKKLADQTKGIQDILLTIYPVNMGSNIDSFNEGVKHGQQYPKG